MFQLSPAVFLTLALSLALQNTPIKTLHSSSNRNQRQSSNLKMTWLNRKTLMR